MPAGRGPALCLIRAHQHAVDTRDGKPAVRIPDAELIGIVFHHGDQFAVPGCGPAFQNDQVLGKYVMFSESGIVDPQGKKTFRRGGGPDAGVNEDHFTG